MKDLFGTERDGNGKKIGTPQGASELKAMLEREAEFRSWWNKNHPFDWWTKERKGVSLPHGDRLLVWEICRRAWMSSNALREPHADTLTEGEETK